MTRPAAADLAELPSAGLLRRLGAMIYDGLLVIAIVLTTTGVLNLFVGRPQALDEGSALRVEDIHVISGALLRSIWFIEIFAFFAWFWVRHGRTLGMQAWRLMVVDGSGGPITLAQAVRRFIAAIPSLGLCGLGYLWRLVDPSGLTWPDRASGTRVVTLPPGWARADDPGAP